MSTAKRFAAAAVAALGLMGLGTGAAAAESSIGELVPLDPSYRACDFTRLNYVPATGSGSGYATITTGGNTVTADVQFAIGTPNTAYQVRLIQGPRSRTQTCNAGDPGVASAVLHTDANGTGALTVQAARWPGATNAWVFVDGPPKPGKIRGDFYTSEILTSLS